MLYPQKSLVLAPLSGYTDIPYRLSAVRHGCNFTFTEMINARSLVFGNNKTVNFLDRHSSEAWLGIQIIGSEPEILKKAVQIINEKNFNVLDFNLGCPAPKVIKKGEGAALAENYDKALKAFEAISQSSQIPLSAKIRILDEKNPETTVKLVKGLENLGAQAVTVHGRVKKAFYSGPVSYKIIQAVNENSSIQIIANGGVKNYNSFCELCEKSSCSVVMIARGAMGNPWIFNSIKNKGFFKHPTVNEFCNELEQHIYEMLNYYKNELYTMKISRKIILDYMKGRGFAHSLKNIVSFIKTENDFKKFVRQVQKGPTERYKSWIKSNPESERKLFL